MTKSHSSLRGHSRSIKKTDLESNADSTQDSPSLAKLPFVCEVSLVGDIRAVSNIDIRLKELESYGFEKVILAKKPKTQCSVKCFEATEVSKILEWM